VRFSEIVNYVMVNTLYERSREYEFVIKYLIPLLTLPKGIRYSIKILDVGGADSRLSKFLSGEGFDVYVIDILEDDYGKAKFVKENILTYEFPNEFFNIIIAISTIEHVGLPDAYGQEVIDSVGDVKTVDKIYRWLKVGGLALITLPFGKPHHPPTFERVYNDKSIWDRILYKGWDVVEIKYYCQSSNDPHNFYECSISEALTKDSCICLALRKIEL